MRSAALCPCPRTGGLLRPHPAPCIATERGQGEGERVHSHVWCTHGNAPTPPTSCPCPAAWLPAAACAGRGCAAAGAPLIGGHPTVIRGQMVGAMALSLGALTA